jgi:TPR repeat protein
VEQDDKQAVTWFTKAAEQGNADAQDLVGFSYYEGNGVEQDYTQATKWYTKSAQQGNANAQCRLGLCYY